MAIQQPDHRSVPRRARDERIAAEAPLAAPQLPPGALPARVEDHLPLRRPLAIAGIVEDGKVRLLEPGVKLPENLRVIVVTTR